MCLFVACLHPHNSLSNVLVSVTIHHDMFIYIYQNNRRDVAKNMKTLWKVINIYMCAYTYTFTHVHMHIHLLLRVCVSFSLLLRVVAVAVSSCGGEGRGGRRQTETVTTDSSAVSLRIAGTGQLYQAQRKFGGIGNVLLSTCSQTEKW